MHKGNEIDPRLMENAHILGSRRTPTATEQKQMEKDAITMAVIQVSATALSSILEGGDPLRDEEVANVAIQVAKDLLEKSEETKDDFGEHIGKRKLRNQLAAQFIYSSLRGGQTYKSNVVHRAFTAAAKLIEEAEAYAESESKKNSPTSDIIAT